MKVTIIVPNAEWAKSYIAQETISRRATGGVRGVEFTRGGLSKQAEVRLER